MNLPSDSRVVMRPVCATGAVPKGDSNLEVRADLDHPAFERDDIA